LLPLWRETADAVHRLRGMSMSADQQHVFINRHGQPLGNCWCDRGASHVASDRTQPKEHTAADLIETAYSAPRAADTDKVGTAFHRRKLRPKIGEPPETRILTVEPLHEGSIRNPKGMRRQRQLWRLPTDLADLSLIVIVPICNGPLFGLSGESNVFRCLVVATTLMLLVFPAGAAGEEQPGFERLGPWLVQVRRNAETGRSEYFAITPSVKDDDFWMGFSCLSDKRVYLSFLKNDSELSDPADHSLSVTIRFDGSSPISIESKFVNAHMLTVNPDASKSILVALIHSQMIEVSISGILQGSSGGLFRVQPYAPALSKLIAACAVAESLDPAQPL
jgi:hypothetical protein